MSRTALTNRARRRWGRGAILLECVLALALFVAAGLTIMGMMDRAASSVADTRDYEIAVDVARSAMAQIEAGIASPETLNGPVPQWRDAMDATFDDDLPDESGWNLEITTEPSQFDGLTKVSVRAFRQDPGSEDELVSYTLHQLVRLTEGGAS
ncbi:MAG TPA: hypothetical protein VD997_00680 [Phycisphaerales bacterium]|nr:hypothetical protein [Phycisphaerales bacterium]